MANNKDIDKLQFKVGESRDGAKIGNGIMSARPKINLVWTLRNLMAKANILPQLVQNIKEEVENGYNKNAIELLKIIKEDERIGVSIQNSINNIQKVYVTPEQDKAATDYIENIINE